MNENITYVSKNINYQINVKGSLIDPEFYFDDILKILNINNKNVLNDLYSDQKKIYYDNQGNILNYITFPGIFKIIKSNYKKEYDSFLYWIITIVMNYKNDHYKK